MEIESVVETTKKYIYDYLLPIIELVGEKLEGNVFFYHENIRLCPDFVQKQWNLVEMVHHLSTRDTTNKRIDILEIGFNAGFSSLLFLIANPNVYLTCVDLGYHRYTCACFERIRDTFGDRIQLFLGDSTKVLPRIHNNFDLIHIDGGHSLEIAEKDIFHICRMLRDYSIIVMDDTNDPVLSDVFQKYSDFMGFDKIIEEKTIYHSIRKYERKNLVPSSLDLSNEKNNIGDIIPKKIFQFWHDKNEITLKMQNCIDVLKNQHSDYEYQLFFIDEAREFIRDFFETKVLEAFDSLVPIAFKSDLWRYCVLYKYGGIYIDLKYECINYFHLSDIFSSSSLEELFIFDINGHSVYNGFMASKPNNPIFLHCINSIVKNVREKNYGYCDLDITGPGLLTYHVPENTKAQITLQHQCMNYNKFILKEGIPILKVYARYYEERKKLQSKTYYEYWRDREMYL